MICSLGPGNRAGPLSGINLSSVHMVVFISPTGMKFGAKYLKQIWRTLSIRSCYSLLWILQLLYRYSCNCMGLFWFAKSLKQNVIMLSWPSSYENAATSIEKWSNHRPRKQLKSGGTIAKGHHDYFQNNCII